MKIFLIFCGRDDIERLNFSLPSSPLLSPPLLSYPLLSLGPHEKILNLAAFEDIEEIINLGIGWHCGYGRTGKFGLKTPAFLSA